MDSGSKTTLGEVRLETSKAPRRLAVFQKRRVGFRMETKTWNRNTFRQNMAIT